MAKVLKFSFLIILLVTLLLMTNLAISVKAEVNLLQYSAKNMNIYALYYECSYEKPIENHYHKSLNTDKFSAALYGSSGSEQMQNKFWITKKHILDIVSCLSQRKTVYYQVGKNNSLNDIRILTWMDRRLMTNNIPARESTLEIIDWSPKEQVYIGDYFRDYFNVFVRIKNTGSRNVCVSQLLLVEWTPKELLEEVRISCENNSRMLYPSNETDVKHCGAFRVLKPGCVKLILSIHECVESLSSRGDTCTCLDRTTIRVVKEVTLQILSRSEKVINENCSTASMPSPVSYQANETIKSPKMRETLHMFSHAEILKMVLYYVFIILSICLVIFIYKLRSFEHSLQR